MVAIQYMGLLLIVDNLTLFDASNCTQIKTIGNYAFKIEIGGILKYHLQ